LLVTRAKFHLSIKKWPPKKRMDKYVSRWGVKANGGPKFLSWWGRISD